MSEGPVTTRLVSAARGRYLTYAQGRRAAQERRRQEVARIDGPPLHGVHTDACRVVPTREDMLGSFPRGGVAAEVGVASGEFSERILALAEPSELHLIDAWETKRYRGGLAVVEARFQDEITKGRIKLNRGYSTEVLSGYDDGFFDFVYIDTSHAYDLTLAELRIAGSKVKHDGLIAGHDFCTGNVVTPVVYGVVQACCVYCREAGWRFRMLSLEPNGHWSFCLERI